MDVIKSFIVSFILISTFSTASFLPPQIPETIMAKAVNTTARLARFRALMQLPHSLKAYIVPTADAHQSEYISSYDARLEYISGFSGSAGTAIVTPDQALLWTDGRYYLQAEAQLDSYWELMKESLPTTPSREKWLLKNLPPGSKVGANPILISQEEWEPLEAALVKEGHSLVPIKDDLVDSVWNELDGSSRPLQPKNEVFPLTLKYTGKSVAEKLKDVRDKMSEKKAQILVITALDEVAYILNLRGTDIPYNPVFYAYVVITVSPPSLVVFVDEARLRHDVIEHLKSEGVENELEIKPYENLIPFLVQLSDQIDPKDGLNTTQINDNVIKKFITEFQKTHNTENQTDSENSSHRSCTMWISHGSSHAVHLAAKNGSSEFGAEKINIVNEITPVELMKAVKNSVETQGLINCHLRDGVALARYFSWLEDQLVNKGAKNITEISAADELEKFRSELTDFMGLSFPTISSSGPHGAIIHYQPDEHSNRLLSVNELYLCDSGAQFRDGTTDVTRTLHFGKPTEDEKKKFTLVLKGQMSLGTAIFPNKIRGNVLDAFARRALWDTGLDYAHGTGHGIGAYLNVHEGPMGISWRQLPNDPGLSENMFLSNEPGYYEDGQFGIRLEDIVRVVTLIPPGKITEGSVLARGLTGNFAGRGALGFETVTMCPIQKKMLDLSLLTEKEVKQIDEYHVKVWERVSPLMKLPQMQLAYDWLKENTSPIRL